jgi:hypothetical protein
MSKCLRDGFGATLRELVTASFALVAALAWNDFAQAAIAELVPKPANSAVAKLLYAGTITLVVVIVVWACRAVHRVCSDFGSEVERKVNNNDFSARSGDDAREDAELLQQKNE